MLVLALDLLAGVKTQDPAQLTHEASRSAPLLPDLSASSKSDAPRPDADGSRLRALAAPVGAVNAGKAALPTGYGSPEFVQQLSSMVAQLEQQNMAIQERENAARAAEKRAIAAEHEEEERATALQGTLDEQQRELTKLRDDVHAMSVEKASLQAEQETMHKQMASMRTKQSSVQALEKRLAEREREVEEKETSLERRAAEERARAENATALADAARAAQADAAQADAAQADAQPALRDEAAEGATGAKRGEPRSPPPHEDPAGARGARSAPPQGEWRGGEDAADRWRGVEQPASMERRADDSGVGRRRAYHIYEEPPQRAPAPRAKQEEEDFFF